MSTQRRSAAAVQTGASTTNSDTQPAICRNDIHYEQVFDATALIILCGHPFSQASYGRHS